MLMLPISSAPVICAGSKISPCASVGLQGCVHADMIAAPLYGHVNVWLFAYVGPEPPSGPQAANSSASNPINPIARRPLTRALRRTVETDGDLAVRPLLPKTPAIAYPPGPAHHQI